MITISINSFIDVKGFQFKLNHGPYYEQINYNELRSTEMIAYDFNDSLLPIGVNFWVELVKKFFK